MPQRFALEPVTALDFELVDPDAPTGVGRLLARASVDHLEREGAVVAICLVEGCPMHVTLGIALRAVEALLASDPGAIHGTEDGADPRKTEGTAGYMAEAYKRTLAPAAKPPPACHLSAEVGERVTFDAEVVRVSSYLLARGTTFITVLRRLPTGTVSGLPVQATPDAGANVVWKSKETIWTRGHGQLAADGSMPAWGEGSWVPAAPGARVTVKATVKAHGAYKGTPQTEVTRLSARAIAEGRNRPQVKAAKPRVRKSEPAPVVYGSGAYVRGVDTRPLSERPGDEDEIPF